MKTWIKSGLTLGTILALTALIFATASCRSGDNFVWDQWSGSKYLADAGDITIDPDPLVANTIAHITFTFDVTEYTDLVSKDSILDPATRTLTVTVYARERDGVSGTWDGTVIVAVTFPDSGLWNVVIPQEGGRTVGLNLDVQPQEGAWAGDPYYPTVGDLTTSPDPLVATDFSHLTFTFDVTENTDLVAKQSELDADNQTLTVTVQARERSGQGGNWDGTVVIPVTFMSGGLWQIIVPQEEGRSETIDLYVEPAPGTPVEDIWAGDPYYPDVGDITTDPDPLVANDFSHITFNFHKTDYTELISQESVLDPVAHTLTVTVRARERQGQLGTWDGTVTVPVTFLEDGVWQFILPQEDDRQAVIDMYVQRAPGEEAWVGESYYPDVGDVVLSPDPPNVNRLTHITIGFVTTSYTELVSQESVLDPATQTLTITVAGRERDNQIADWNGEVVVPVTFLERGIWHIVIPQEDGHEFALDVYVYPQEDIWEGDPYMPDAGDITIIPDPVYLNDLAHITVNFNTTEYTELISQEWVMDAGSSTLTITVYARERADRSADWDGYVTVPATFLSIGVWHIVVEQEGGTTASVDLYVNPIAP